ncbi:MAG: Rpn family recombination-promoting nuclease/putative transposase [Lachnospiraceae bacterium]|nr:Rpn family recombination-promoting nuclease/putative transposase [Lachnospiraceae bacterium]
MRQETKKDVLAARQKGSEYDEACKRLFQNKEILAPILKRVVKEYEDCTTEEIIRYIDENSIKGVPLEDIPVGIKGLPTELSSVSEKLIMYDVHFEAVNPKLSSKKITILLHIDLEVQNDYKPSNPSYPIIKRGIYYGAREISRQLGTLTDITDYSKIQKVYSIWICNRNIPKNLHNTITEYSITKRDVLGQTDEPEKDYDLMTVIVIRRSDNEKENTDSALLDYLDAVFEANLLHIDDYVDVRQNPKAVEEVGRMNGLGDSIYEHGISQGFDLFGRLMNLLLEAGRVDDAKKASTDEAARDRFLREFNLIE